MTTTDIIINLGLGIISGFISGVISGVWITKHYRNKDSEYQWRRSLSDDKQNLSQFINEIKYELDLHINESEAKDKAYLRRLINKAPRFESFDAKKIEEKYHNATADTYSLFDELSSYLDTNEVEINKLNDFRRRIVLAQMEILKINTKPINITITND